MRLVPIAGASCASANCPTVYVNDEDQDIEDQDIFVQGYAASELPTPSGAVPPGEALVRIPRAVFLAAAAKLPTQG
ncbi:hypothetical protein [Frankia sp. R82]|uniref:hypothetical protein n=1 Tax=Frankia sp. R82 TaxID=2950553 RepID=UPI0020439310|nr:hypothetical protein [Frankia sp. R82]MCM3882432.1 hypothetical protein [Frankia sp. R82]